MNTSAVDARKKPRKDILVNRSRRQFRTLSGIFATASIRYGSFAILVGIWALAAMYLREQGAKEYILPPPSAVVDALRQSIHQGVLPGGFAKSLVHLALAGSIGLCGGILIGLLIGMNRWVARFFYPLLNFFQSISGIALIPLIIVWFGRSTMGLIIAVNYAVLFPVIFNTVIGVRTVPEMYISAVRTLGAGPIRIAREVILPGALPNILLGARLGLAYGWRALIAAEMLFAINGLGFMIFDARQFLDTPTIMLGMIVLGVLWMFIDRMIIDPIEIMTIQRWGMVRS